MEKIKVYFVNGKELILQADSATLKEHSEYLNAKRVEKLNDNNEVVEYYENPLALSDEQIYKLCDMGALNGVIKGYILLAFKEMGIDFKSNGQAIKNSFINALDLHNAEEAEEFYDKFFFN